ncbi:ABC transporter permease subunit, partial [Clostridia bacterium OttesenSCG-928-F22]|nr:ABC transporter permease subunit [Clostridia bacterium OttesenSCG-928-F22]
MKKRIKGSSALKILLGIFFLFSIILPLLRMFLLMGETDVIALVTSERFLLALGNSFTVAAVSTVISVALATVLAWCVARCRIWIRGVWMLLLTLPMLIPSISHGMGLVVLFGANGVLTNLFQMSGSIYGFWGIVTGSVLYSFPVAFLMILDVLKYEDSTPYEAAAVLGIPKRRQISAITFPYLRRPMISAVFAVFTMVITDYGVPLMIGGQ